MPRSRLPRLMLVLTLVGGLLAAAGSVAAEGGGPAFVPDEVLVQFSADASAAQRDAALSSVGAARLELVRASADGNVELVRLPPGRAVADAARGLQSQAGVVFAEPNWIYTHGAASNDPYFTNGSLWGMYGDASSPANQYGSQAAEAWAAGTDGSRSVYVGIIDEGVQFTHPDLDANAWVNSFDPVDGVDNDANGYVDDIHGWDFAGNNNSVYDGGRKGNADDHGTHVTGTIGAEGGNGGGVVGVNWEVTYISAKFLGRLGGTTANAVKAVDYITDLKTRHGLNIVATNNSWGGGGFSQALYDAIERANAANILFIAAAGNGGADSVGDNNDTTPHYPSSYTNANIIAVAAITSTGAKSGFSNYGPTSVDIGAPGSAVWSTTALNTYSSYSGTSMATPHVTGAAALYASTHSGATAAQIKSAILSSAIPTASLAGKVVTAGRLDANAALSR